MDKFEKIGVGILICVAISGMIFVSGALLYALYHSVTHGYWAFAILFLIILLTGIGFTFIEIGDTKNNKDG